MVCSSRSGNKFDIDIAKLLIDNFKDQININVKGERDGYTALI